MEGHKTGVLFCISCWFTCDDQRQYRQHYSSEWHCFNLERKRQRQPHVTEEVFQKLLAKSLEHKKELEAEKSGGKSWHCNICCKKFKSDNSYQNHLFSKRHLSAAKEAASRGVLVENGKTSEGEEEEEDDDDALEVEEWNEEDYLGDPIPPTQCFFCNKKSSSIDKNLKHMSDSHTFFLPDIDYLVDIEGLLTLLGEKVGKYHLCLWCNERSRMFLETRDVQLHMSDKSHCKVNHHGDALLEYSDFYDYRKAYPDYRSDDEEEEEDERFTKPEPLDLDHTGLQLVLPSGATVGHRSLNVYFKQKLDATRQVACYNKTALQNTIMHYKKIGCKTISVQEAALKARDLAYVERRRKQEYVRLGVKHNKLQKHFRRQIIGC